ncbi:MAG: DUF6197 family protein [Nitrososphaerales archaeon]
MDTKQDLIDAKSLISDPSNWGHGWQDTSHRYCALQACRKVAGFYSQDNAIRNNALLRFSRIRDSLEQALYEVTHAYQLGVAHYNDESTHHEVMALFDQAIASFSD